MTKLVPQNGTRQCLPDTLPEPFHWKGMPIRELRDLTRHRRKLVETQAAERNRLLKLLETANIKLSSVATDVFGVSGRLMLRALIEGKATPPHAVSETKRTLKPRFCSTVVV